MLKELLKALWAIRDAIGGKKENQSSDGKVFGFYFPDAIGAFLVPENVGNEGAPEGGGTSEGMIPPEPSESEDTEIELTPVIFENIDDFAEHFSEYAARFHVDETGIIFYPLYKNNNLEVTECVSAIQLIVNKGMVQLGPIIMKEIPEGHGLKFKRDKFEGYYYIWPESDVDSEG